ncbi:MAG TPA: hypothetical protein H9891_09850 [Candidatus Salinicoccus stercoripullorum]|uniref:Uncharacterized protein n=1 Tax=Candidatus Salinicoccus stercoripullorum TaxID=2838756 RepID=A0A9D1U0N8_9STAP|nr:hypothetical protein [Candidatus Salinicoccus stercoripullorum]
MNGLKLLLDLNTETDNLYVETDMEARAMYQIFGFGPLEEENVSDDPRKITFEAGGRNALAGISKPDVDYLLGASIITFGTDTVCIYEFENKKLSGLEKAGDDLYEISLKEQTSIENGSVAEMLSSEFYSLEYDDTRDDLPLSTNRLLIFLFGEKERIYRDGILADGKYDGFIETVNRFMEDYDVEFEQSEGTELVLSTVYLMREYLNQDWEQVYGLLEKR